MIDSNFIKNKKNGIKNVSRETLEELKNFSLSILKKNKEINLISESTEKSINTRHIEDSAQIIDFIDKNDINICTDLGSGAGLPGIVLAILMKPKKPLFKVILYEKSFHKSNFLKEVSEKLELRTTIYKKNIFDEKNLKTDSIVARAFKPLPVILNLAYENFSKFKNIIVFLGKNGKETLKESLRNWKFEYEEKRSITSDDSFLIKITNLKKYE